MFRRLWHAIRPAILWSYRRGSWQYDVIVVLILAFIFLTPSKFFNDQPRLPSVRQFGAMTDDQGTQVFLIEPFELDGTSEADQSGRLQELLRRRTGEDLHVIEARPTTDESGDVTAYLVYARP